MEAWKIVPENFGFAVKAKQNEFITLKTVFESFLKAVFSDVSNYFSSES